MLNGKMSDERLTVGTCSNSLGEKRDLVMIGKAENLDALKMLVN